MNLSFNKFIKSLSNSIACNFLISESNNLEVKAPLPGPISKIKSNILDYKEEKIKDKNRLLLRILTTKLSAIK